MRNALETHAEALGIDIETGSDYATLSEGRKDAVAQDMLDNRPTNPGFQTTEEVQELFDLLVAFRLAVQDAVTAANAGSLTAADFVEGGLIYEVGEALKHFPQERKLMESSLMVMMWMMLSTFSMIWVSHTRCNISGH